MTYYWVPAAQDGCGCRGPETLSLVSVMRITNEGAARCLSGEVKLKVVGFRDSKVLACSGGKKENFPFLFKTIMIRVF